MGKGGGGHLEGKHEEGGAAALQDRGEDGDIEYERLAGCRCYNMGQTGGGRIQFMNESFSCGRRCCCLCCRR